MKIININIASMLIEIKNPIEPNKKEIDKFCDFIKDVLIKK